MRRAPASGEHASPVYLLWKGLDFRRYDMQRSKASGSTDTGPLEVCPMVSGNQDLAARVLWVASGPHSEKVNCWFLPKSDNT